MASKVWFIDLRTTYRENMLQKLGRLLDAAGLPGTFNKRDLVAIKLHFGEQGNTAFIRPIYIRRIVENVKKDGGAPFITDANTVYAGTRSDTPNHLATAIRNGFDYAVVDAPLVIADGLRGRSETAVAINRKRFQEVYIGDEIVAADALVSVAHFKGHELSGFGGALKNLGMGCASRRGKLAQHSTVSPKVKTRLCTGCGECIRHCSPGAIRIKDKKAVIHPETCIGCGECIIICPERAPQIQWNAAVPHFLENMMEYAEGAVKGKENKLFCVNFITDVSPGCDCMPHNDAPIVRNIGILASRDPVAIDKASIDLVNQEQAIAGSCLTKNTGPGEDKFRGIYDYIDWNHQFVYAEELGIGTCDYELIRLAPKEKQKKGRKSE